MVLLGMIGLIIGHLNIIGMGTLPITFIGMKMAAPRYAKFKQNKPYGYLTVKLRLYLHDEIFSVFSHPYVRRLGRWSTETTIQSIKQR